MSFTEVEAIDLEEINLDAFNRLSLSAEDEAREAVFLHAQKDCLHGSAIESTARSSSGYRAWTVFNGQEMGVFETWAATLAQVNGFLGGSQQGFSTYAEAQAAWDHACASHVVGPPLTPPSVKTCVLPVPTHTSNIGTPPPSPTPMRHHSGCVFYPPIDPAPDPEIIIDRSLPEIQLPWSPSPGLVIPPPPCHGHFQPLPSLPSTPGRHLVVMMRRSPIIPQLALSDEAAFWVVTSGAHLGVYQGKAAAYAAIGNHSPHRVVKVGSRVQADRVFANKYMEGKVVEVYME